MSENPLSIPRALRWPRYPRPRDVEVFCEHHCSADCVHITEAHRLGREQGIRDERARYKGDEGHVAMVAVTSFLLGVAVAVTLQVAVLFVAGK